MFWKLDAVDVEAENALAEGKAPEAGRFVLHRHTDAAGPHLDLRLEQDGYLLGWRIDGLRLEDGPWATEKAPHPTRWLEQDGEAVREDAGVYAWITRDEEHCEVELRGQTGARRIRVKREAGLPARCVGAICDALRTHEAAPDQAARLIADGVTARKRAIERFCGLGRELDGRAFDEAVWRKTLGTLSLREIHSHLEALEVRFDRKYPPAPVSRPEPLPEEQPDGSWQRAVGILRD